MSNKMENGTTNCDKTSKDAPEVLTPELLYKMNKKIAQLTKVVYGLNTRNEELELQLNAARENEEKTRLQNSDLQARVNNFKSKIEAEMAKLRELEAQSNEAQFWKQECETLKRRLETDGGSTESKIHLGRAVEEIEQLRMREKSAQYELEQAKHTIVNLKAHHDFIMRERDSHESMEREKIILEWQTRVVDIEARYKSQIRHATDELEMLSEQCTALRKQNGSTSNENGCYESLPESEDQQTIMRKIREQNQEIIEMRNEIIELQRKLHHANEETRTIDEKWEKSNRMTSERYEARIKELASQCDILQKLDTEREVEYSNRMRSKLREIQEERDIVEEGYSRELQNLKLQNEKHQIEIATLRQSCDKTTTDYISKIESLEQQLAEKVNDLELKTKNFKVRINMLESRNKQLQLDKAKESQLLKQESEKYRQLKMDHEAHNDDMRTDLEARIHKMEHTEKDLRYRCKTQYENCEALNKEIIALKRKIEDKDREVEDRLHQEKDMIETRARLNLESSWLERLKEKEQKYEEEIKKLEEDWKRKEMTFKDEKEKIIVEHEASQRMQEESRKKIREMRMQELELGKKQTMLQNTIRDLKKEVDIATKIQSDMEIQSRKQKTEIEKLNQQLAVNHEQIDKLKRDLDASRKDCIRLSRDLEESRKKNAATTELEMKMQEFRRQLREKESLVESLRVDLQYSKNEGDLCKTKITRLEDDLRQSDQKCKTLQQQCTTKTNDKGKKLTVAEEKVKELQKELKKKDSVIAELQTSLQSIDDEREEEMKIVQDALDEAAEEREAILKTFQKELESANSKNIAREQQMLEDFEWKLREREKEFKNKISENDNLSQAQLDTVRSMVESELSESLLKVAEDRKIADEKYSEVAHLKSYEAEAHQLRGVTFEFQKALRESSREMENMKIRHMLFEEEIKTLKRGSQTKQNPLNRKKQTEDDDQKKKISKIKKDLNTEWQQRLNEETSQLKSDLENSFERKKTLAVENITDKYEAELESLKKNYASREAELTAEMDNLKKMMSEKEANHNKEIEELRTSTDRDIWELRMKLRKLDDMSYDKEQNLIEKHTEEIETLRKDYDEQIRELNAKLQELQTLKDTIANLTEQHNEQLEHLSRQHQEMIDKLKQDYESEKQEIVELNKLSDEAKADSSTETYYADECEKHKRDLETTKASILNRDETIRMLQSQLDKLKTSHNASEASLSNSSLVTRDSNDSTTSRSNSQTSSENGQSDRGNDNQEDMMSEEFFSSESAEED